MNREPWQVYCHLALSISVPLAAFLTVSVQILFCQLSFRIDHQVRLGS